MKGGFEELNAKLEAATAGLAGISRKRVFGRNTFFVDGKLFALVWREGRIGLKLPDEALHAELSQLPGAVPWVAWGRSMAQWLLVPLTMQHDAPLLASWVKRSGEAVRAAAPAPAAEMAATRLEPIPAAAAVPRIPSGPPNVPSAAPKIVSAPPVPKPVSAPPVPKPVSAAPAPSASKAAPPVSAAPVAKAPSGPAEGGEFSFGEEGEAEAAVVPPAPKVPSLAPTPEVADDPDAFSFDAPEAEASAAPGAGTESQEFDFGGGDDSAPDQAPAAESPASDASKKKKGGKGKKRAG